MPTGTIRGATMRGMLMLTGIVAAGAAVVGVALLAVLSEGQLEPASASTDPGASPVRTRASLRRARSIRRPESST